MNGPPNVAEQVGIAMVVQQEQHFQIVYIQEVRRAGILYPRALRSGQIPLWLGSVFNCKFRAIELREETMRAPYEITWVKERPDITNEVKIVDNSRCQTLLSFNLAQPMEKYTWWAKLSSQFVLPCTEMEYIVTENPIVDKGERQSANNIIQRYAGQQSARCVVGWCELRYTVTPLALVAGGQNYEQEEVKTWVWVLREVVSPAAEFSGQSHPRGKESAETGHAPPQQQHQGYQQPHQGYQQPDQHYPTNWAPTGPHQSQQMPPQAFQQQQYHNQQQTGQQGNWGQYGQAPPPQQPQMYQPQYQQASFQQPGSWQPTGPLLPPQAYYHNGQGAPLDQQMRNLNMGGMNHPQKDAHHSQPHHEYQQSASASYPPPPKSRSLHSAGSYSPTPPPSVRQQPVFVEQPVRQQPAPSQSSAHSEYANSLRSRAEALAREAEKVRAEADAEEIMEEMAKCHQSLNVFMSHPQLCVRMKALDLDSFMDLENFLGAFPKVRAGVAKFK